MLVKGDPGNFAHGQQHALIIVLHMCHKSVICQEGSFNNNAIHAGEMLFLARKRSHLYMPLQQHMVHILICVWLHLHKSI